ncbi:Crp/Fnr family transcriptional regulator [Polaribacter sp. R77954]|uniref:Crp/Fnr family transcriptional regulator n=1 Tax=Polaribacter sp. R77954 TaxID=3093870 RepID=UPI0037CAE245
MINNNHLCIGKQFNYLKSLTDDEKKSFFERSKLIKLKKDEIVFLEHDRLKSLYTICEGACKYTYIDDKGKEHITKILGKGDVMGRRSLITNKGALFTAIAISDTVIYAINKKVILQSLESNNNFCQDILKGFIFDAEDEAEKITYFQNNRKLKIRLAGLLLYLSKKFGTDKKGWLNVVPKRKDIANILGTTSEYLISLLSAFKEKNYVSLTRDSIKINSEEKLLIFINSK